MKKGRIGVLFFVALGIFLFSLWAGTFLGPTIARYWYRHKQQAQIKSGGPERAHLESTLSRLDNVTSLYLVAILPTVDKQLGEMSLLDEIGVLEGIERKADLQDIKPAIDFNIGRAYVYASILEEQAHNDEQARQYMNSAQTRFQSLGWSDSTEETLKSMVAREVDKWKHPPQSRDYWK